MNNLLDIQAQIEKLKKQEQQIKAKDFAKTVQDIQEKMQAFGITLKDLQLPKSARRVGTQKAPAKKPGKAASRSTGSKVPAKYRGVEGQSWSGRGLMPLWLRGLIAEGRSREEFLVG